MHQKRAGRIANSQNKLILANSVDPDQTALRSSLIRVYTVCPDIAVPILKASTFLILHVLIKYEPAYYSVQCKNSV